MQLIDHVKFYCKLNRVFSNEKPPCDGCDETCRSLYGNKKRNRRCKVKRPLVLERDKKCLKCGSADELTLDHIIPRGLGGTNELDNLQTLCRKCNEEKGDEVIDYRNN